MAYSWLKYEMSLTLAVWSVAGPFSTIIIHQHPWSNLPLFWSDIWVGWYEILYELLNDCVNFSVSSQLNYLRRRYNKSTQSLGVCVYVYVHVYMCIYKFICIYKFMFIWILPKYVVCVCVSAYTYSGAKHEFYAVTYEILFNSEVV